MVWQGEIILKTATIFRSRVGYGEFLKKSKHSMFRLQSSECLDDTADGDVESKYRLQWIHYRVAQIAALPNPRGCCNLLLQWTPQKTETMRNSLHSGKRDALCLLFYSELALSERKLAALSVKLSNEFQIRRD